MTRLFIVLSLLVALAGSPAWSQQEAASPSAAPAAAPAAPVAPAAPAVDVEAAYRKEFAFLTAQKRELSRQIDTLKASSQSQQGALRNELASLQARVLTAENEAELAADALSVADQRAFTNQENSGLLEATFAQGSISLEAFGMDLANESSFAEADDASKLQQLLRAGERVLAESSQTRSEQGQFYLGDGSEVSGQIVRVGNIARYGISEAAAGALAPAGGGRFKLWRDDAADSARALAGGGSVDTLRVFLYENANTAVSEPEVKTVAGEVRKGGLVGYVIVSLGVIALILMVLRALFLSNAGSSINKIQTAVEPLLKQRRIDDAIAATKRFKGSAARVVTSALRNLDRDRDHLEDIVSEAILHENTRLNRFGAIILMIAGVAPLLGLLGTVTGMIQTFAVITEFGTSDPKLLAGGIATALVTTELGLIVAIPCLLGGNLLGGWAERLKDDMEKAALAVINLFKDAAPQARAA